MKSRSFENLARNVLRKYKPVRLVTEFWQPGTSSIDKLTEVLEGKVGNGDVVVVSEKALLVSRGLMVDESYIEPSFASKLLTFILMRLIWGYFLGPLCKLKPQTINYLRNYPLKEGTRHKSLVLKLGGLMEFFKPFSEAGVDGSNLPGSLVSIPLLNPFHEAWKIKSAIKNKLGVDATVVISDSDRLYLHRYLNLVLTCRRSYVEGFIHFGSIAYIVGRMFRKRFIPLATPLALAGDRLDRYTLLGLTELADRLRGVGAGRTIFEMAERFRVGLNEVTWDMLRSIEHCPAVLFKLRGSKES